MSIYRVELDDGRVLRIEVDGDTPPTEEDIIQYLDSNPEIPSIENTGQPNKNVFLDSLKRSAAETAYGALKHLSGRSYGASDAALKALGVNVDDLYNYVESGNDFAKPLGFAAELYGNIKTGGKLLGKALKGVETLEAKAAVKNAPKLTKELAKIARVGYLPATGFAEGAAIGGFDTGTLEGALAGGAFGAGAAGAMGAGGALLRKVFSAADAAPKLKRTVPEAAKDPDTYKVLDTSVGSNPVVAEGVSGKMLDTKRALNKEVIDEIDNVYGKGNYEEGVNQARAAFKANINENAGIQLFDMDNNVNYASASALKKIKKQKASKIKYLADALGFEQGQLSYTQEQWLKRLWDSARESATSRAAGRQGDYGHVQRFIQDLNGLIKKSRRPDAIFPDGTPQVNTAELIDLRNKFMDLPNMIKNPVSAQYAKAMRLQDAYEYGLQHSPKSIKQYNFNTPDEELAFYRGVLDKAKNNPEIANVAKEVMKQADVLADAKVPRAEELLRNLEKRSKFYENAEALGAKADKKVWGSSGIKNISLPTSSVKMILDAAQDIATGRKYRKLGKYILDPTKEIAPLNIIPYYNFGQQTTNALIRALSEQESK